MKGKDMAMTYEGGYRYSRMGITDETDLSGGQALAQAERLLAHWRKNGKEQSIRYWTGYRDAIVQAMKERGEYDGI